MKETIKEKEILTLTESGWRKFKNYTKKRVNGKRYVLKDNKWIEVEIDTSRQQPKENNYTPTPCCMEHLF